MMERSRALSAIRWLAHFEKKLGCVDVEDRALKSLREMEAEAADCLAGVRKELYATTARGRRCELRSAAKDMTQVLSEIREAIGDIEFWIDLRRARG